MKFCGGIMSKFLIPLAILSVNFLSLIFCIRFLFSSKGYTWITASVISILLTGVSAISLASHTSADLPDIFGRFADSGTYVLGIFSVIWFFNTLIFHFRIKDKKKYLLDAEKNREETFYIRNATGAHERIEKASSPKPSGKRLVTPSDNNTEWDDCFE